MVKLHTNTSLHAQNPEMLCSNHLHLFIAQMEKETTRLKLFKPLG